MISAAIELVFNITILVALTLFSGFIRQREDNPTRAAVLQGLLFGAAAVIGMYRPMVLGPGLIFDGRSVMISLCALYFGPLAAAVSVAVSLPYRLQLGGVGVVMGTLTIGVAALWGLYWRQRWLSRAQPITTRGLLTLGLCVHATLPLLTLTLPVQAARDTLYNVGLPMLLAYPLITLLIGKILSSQAAALQTVQALRDSEWHHRMLADNVSDVIWTMTPDGRFSYVSPSVQKLRGFTAAEVMQQSMADTLCPDSLARAQRHLQIALSSRSLDRPDLCLELEHTCKDGSTVWTEATITGLRDANGGLTGTLGVSRDITERRRAQQSLRESKELTDAIVENVPLMVFLKEAQDLRFVLFNRAGEELLGYDRQTLVGKSDRDFFPPEQAAHFIARDREVLQAAGVIETSEEPIQTAHQGQRLLHTRKVSIRGLDGQPKYLLGISEDITERKQAEQQLLLTASVFTHAREGIAITDARGVILDVNGAFTRITGYSRDEVLGKTPKILNSGRHAPGFYQDMWRDLLLEGQWYGEIWNRRKSGEVFAEMLNISAVRDAQGQTRNYVALFSDITALKQHESELEHIAHYDVLTGLPNRVLLGDRMHQAMAQAVRRQQQLGVVYLDLDGFKAVNDRHGHEAGDLLLLTVATRMKAALRDCDTLGRIGGDEFVAVLMDLADGPSCIALLQRLLDAASEPVQHGELVLQISASLGVTLYPQAEDLEADQLLRQADQAMYQAKLAGKNRYHFFDDAQDRQARGRHETLANIRQALTRREFVLFYQPKINMRSGALIGMEALIRWQHPQRGLLAPAHFLPAIEDHPLAVDVGEWVLATALAQMAQWQAAGLALTVSVNVGARQLQQPNFVTRLRALLVAQPTVRPEQLEIEVLETSALEDIQGVSKVIQDCSDMGVRFALDDFGTGYSSLTYLKRLPVAVLKIDQSFVRDMLVDADDLAILQGIIGLAGAFRREVIAEGVETAAHGQRLLQLGCDLGQGYGIARPMPAGEVMAWAARWQAKPVWAAPVDPGL